MKRIPFFIEVAGTQEPKEVQLCSQVWRTMAKNKIAPLPFAHSMAEIKEILATMKRGGSEPSIFLINTFNARDLLEELDPLMGDKPAVYFRRALFQGESGLMDRMIPDPDKAMTVHILGQMTPRLISLWTYGAKNSAHIAERAAKCLLDFIADGTFRYFETAKKLERI